MNIWEIDKLYLFVMFVVPGFISIKTYELLIPNHSKDTSKQLIDAITYSCINYAIWYFLILEVESSNFPRIHSKLYSIFYFFILFISPILIVFVWKRLRSTDFFQSNSPHPTEKPWDWVFAQRKPFWMKIYLKDGKIIGGLYSTNSFASSSPASEQLYLEETWIINDKGGFDRKKNETAGVIILNVDISYIELINFRR